jgi:hypothetical protein
MNENENSGGGRRSLAHFHVYYQEHTAVYSIDPVALIAGYLPQRQQ